MRSPRAAHTRLVPCAFALLFALGLGPARTEAATIQVTVDTSALSGTSASLSWDLTDGDPGASTTAIITGFSTNGSFDASQATSTGGVSGSLPGPVTITDTDFFNSLLQPLTLGTSVSFTVDMTTAASGQGVPDTLAFFLLTADGLASLVATDLVGDALVTLEADGTAGGHLGVAGETEPVVAVSATRTTAVPAPAALLLLAAALLPTLLRARR
jgi:hypothetical protein